MSTYTPIASIKLASATQTIEFANIPQYYTDLVISASRQFDNVSTGSQNTLIRFNDDSGANYGNNYFTADPASGVIPNVTNLLTSGPGNSTANLFSTDVWNIFNYSKTNQYKSTIFTYMFAGGNMNQTWAGSWRNTSAITKISIIGSSTATFAAGSTFDLYGIVAGGGYATGGDIVTTDGTYWYHAFLSSGAFTPTKNLLVDYAVVGGGGSGGQPGSGGGAGGFRTFTSQSLTANTIYTATIGGGGSAQYYNIGSDGSSSSFNSASSAGGGGGGGYEQNGRSGGSGGGAGGRGSSATGTGGAGNTPSTSPSQGNNGGTGTGDLQAGGGGGGAGAAGSNATNTSNTSFGGVGSSAISSWGLATGTGQNDSGTVYFAGGGGGSRNSSGSGVAGGLGGGGAGQWSASTSGSPQSGTANTGGGGGSAGGNMAYAGNGGSGIVIVRYAV